MCEREAEEKQGAAGADGADGADHVELIETKKILIGNEVLRSLWTKKGRVTII